MEKKQKERQFWPLRPSDSLLSATAITRRLAKPINSGGNRAERYDNELHRFLRWHKAQLKKMATRLISRSAQCSCRFERLRRDPCRCEKQIVLNMNILGSISLADDTTIYFISSMAQSSAASSCDRVNWLRQMFLLFWSGSAGIPWRWLRKIHCTKYAASGSSVVADWMHKI